MLPRYEPVPPRIDAPPMATAAIEVNRNGSPMPRYDCLALPANRIPASAAVVPLMAYAMMVVRATGHPRQRRHGAVAAHRVQVPPEGGQPLDHERERRPGRPRRAASPARPRCDRCRSTGARAAAGGGGKPRVATSSSPWSTTFMDSVMTMGGMPRRAMPTPLTVPTSAPNARHSGTAHRSARVVAPRQRGHEHARARERPGHRQVDAPADDDHRLADGHDADERRADDERAHVGGIGEARRVEAHQARTGRPPRATRGRRDRWSCGRSRNLLM